MFFSYTDYGETLELFTLQHFLAGLIFAFLPCLLIIFFKDKIKNSKYEKTLRYAISYITLLFELLLYLWYIISGGIRDWRMVVPSTLCGLTLFLACYSMFTLSKKISPVIYYYSYGAAVSFIASDISYGYNRFRFYTFFIIHGLILVMAVYLRVINGVKSDKKAYIRSMLILLPILIISVLLNQIFDMNFFYMEMPIFDNAPIYTDLFLINKYFYSLAVLVTYFILNSMMFAIAKVSKIDR